MLHIELNTLRETVWRYNLTEQQLYASVLVPWKRGETIELGEHNWPPEETKIVILDAPQLPPGLLTMGRGWMNVKRQGKDVTAEVLSNFEERFAVAQASRPAAPAGRPAAPDAAADGGPAPNGSNGAPKPGFVKPAAPAVAPPAVPSAGAYAAGGSPGAADSVLVDAFGLELLKAISGAPISLNSAWRLAGDRHPQLDAGGSLELAMSAVASLLSSSLVVLGSVAENGAVRALDAPPQQLAERVREMNGWLADTGPGSLRISRG
jgi:hypothetical protein